MGHRTVGFTLMELMVVVLIISILAAVAVPLMQIRLENSKWTEANTAAGMIRTAAKTTFFQTGTSVIGSLGDPDNLAALGIETGDLTGTYFVPSDYEIVSVNADGAAVVRVTGSQPKAPPGSKTLTAEGEWE